MNTLAKSKVNGPKKLLAVIFIFTLALGHVALAKGGMSGGSLYCGDRPLSDAYILPIDLGESWQNFQGLVAAVSKHLPTLAKKLSEVGGNYIIDSDKLSGCEFIENKDTSEKLEFRKLGIGKLSTPILVVPEWNLILVYNKFKKLPIDEQTLAVLNESLRGLCGVSGVSSANCVQQSKNVLRGHFLQGERTIDAWKLAAELTGFDNSHPKSLRFIDVGLPGTLDAVFAQKRKELSVLFRQYITAKAKVINNINSENQPEKLLNDCSLSMDTPVEFINNEAQFTTFTEVQKYFPYVMTACEKGDVIKAPELTKIVNEIEDILSQAKKETDKIHENQGLVPLDLPIFYMWGNYPTFFETLSNGTTSYNESFIKDGGIKEY